MPKGEYSSPYREVGISSSIRTRRKLVPVPTFGFAHIPKNDHVWRMVIGDRYSGYAKCINCGKPRVAVEFLACRRKRGKR